MSDRATSIYIYLRGMEVPFCIVEILEDQPSYFKVNKKSFFTNKIPNPEILKSEA